MALKKPRKSQDRSSAAKGARVDLAHLSKPSRRGPVQARARQTVDAIVEAAGQLLVIYGRAAITTNAVATRAGVSIGSLYQYFPNKESIFEALRERHKHQVMPLVQHAVDNLADPQVDIVDGIVALMRGLVQLHESAPARMRVLVDELGEGEMDNEGEAFVSAVAELLRVRTGLPAEALRPTAWLACTTVTQLGRTLVHRPPAFDIEALLGELAHMLRGLFHQAYDHIAHDDV
jgi:AcrR family transcriptional regulator